VSARPATPALEARRLARQLEALEEGEIRSRAAARALAAMAPDVAAQVLAELVRLAGRGEPAAMAAMGQALLQGALPYDETAALYAAAAERGLTQVQALLVRSPGREGRENPPDRADPLLETATLGHRKTLARTQRDRDALARLSADADPAVVRELLRNPRLTEDAVVRIAARRPTRAETLRCVFEDRRWRVRRPVQVALAKNPWLEPAIALQLLPALDARALREIAEDRQLAAAVRALARRLAVLRRE
jgi:hypothetical protein